MAYKISLITPVYNAEPYLAQALASVKAQTIGFENIEWLLVDDCSTDDSCTLLEKWAAEYPNLRVLRTEKNSGNAGAPRNLGMQAASAEYLMFLDNDDRLFPDACRALYEAMQVGGADIASGYWRARARTGSRFAAENRDFVHNVRAGTYSLADCDFETGHFFANDFWTKIYRRGLVEAWNVRFNEGNMLEDLAFLYQYLVHCGGCRVVETGVIDYYVRDDSHGHDRAVPFFTQMPVSLDFTLEKTAACGKDALFLELLGRYCLVEYAVGMMLEAKSYTEDEVRAVLQSWQRWLRIADEHGFNLPSSYAQILAHGAGNCDLDTQVFNFLALRALYWQRRSELDGIYGSTTWRLAKAAQKLKFWAK